VARRRHTHTWAEKRRPEEGRRLGAEERKTEEEGGGKVDRRPEQIWEAQGLPDQQREQVVDALGEVDWRRSRSARCGTSSIGSDDEQSPSTPPDLL
jgi:hypothetical protein